MKCFAILFIGNTIVDGLRSHVMPGNLAWGLAVKWISAWWWKLAPLRRKGIQADKIPWKGSECHVRFWRRSCGITEMKEILSFEHWSHCFISFVHLCLLSYAQRAGLQAVSAKAGFIYIVEYRHFWKMVLFSEELRTTCILTHVFLVCDGQSFSM